MTTSPRYPWLFAARVDLAVFLGSAAISMALLGLGAVVGVLHSETPEWMWIPAVLLIDVAHVWATTFRVYFDRRERMRRPLLYAATPLVAWIVGVALYSEGALTFWRVIAYMAVFHFVRQQYGWMVLYRARAGERERLGRWIDTCAIYAATIYPLIHWHANQPRRFSWFLPGDFTELPALIEAIAAPLYVLALTAYAIRSLHGWITGSRRNPGADIVVATTSLCWYVGIVWFNSDYAFTVTNVVIHGVPYVALVYWYGRQRQAAGAGGAMRVFAAGPWLFLVALFAFAIAEELLWDRAIWHERSWLFGAPWSTGQTLEMILVPLLAVPQVTHYVLDGFIWRRRANPDFRLGTA